MVLVIKAIFLILGLVFGLFAFNQIIFPLFFTLPRIIRLKRKDKLKPIPISKFFFHFFLSPNIWGLLLFGTILLLYIYFPGYLYTFLIGLVIALIVIIVQFFLKNKEELEAEFHKVWEDYLRHH